MELLIKIFIYAPPLLIAVILHEIAHGYVALRLGDPTARNLGRLSLNPIKHIDPFMTILLPAMLIFSGSPIVFGGAKPVPVDPRYFANPRKGMALVAIAGPITNFVLAILFYILFRFYFAGSSIDSSSIIGDFTMQWLILGIMVNLVLGLFNLFPVPPLDGGRILVGLLPLELAKKLASLERFGLLILVVALMSGIIESVLKFPLMTVISHLAALTSGG
jgi:Zn-dependent protease